jgi:hypothetical protein
MTEDALRPFRVKPLFPLGRLVATPEALIRAIDHGVSVPELVLRHATGDWGDVDAADRRENDLAVTRRLRILSAYGEGDARLWLITEADRSATTLLRPEDY